MGAAAAMDVNILLVFLGGAGRQGRMRGLDWRAPSMATENNGKETAGDYTETDRCRLRNGGARAHGKSCRKSRKRRQLEKESGGDWDLLLLVN